MSIRKHYLRPLCVILIFLIVIWSILSKNLSYDVRTYRSANEQWTNSKLLKRHVTEDGMYPLPKQPAYQNRWKNDSVVPKKFFMHTPGISKHDYKWLLNPFRICSPQVDNSVYAELEQIFLLVTIASASWEFERRDIIRRTWASVQNPCGKTVKYLFFVGSDQTSNVRILQEYDKHGDIVMENFMETYKNLTTKTQGQLKWATYFCPNARYVMHIDDDVFANIKGLVNYLLKEKEDRLLHCGRVFMPKVRRDGKWKMSESEYEGTQYPLSCVGWCFIMPQQVANELYYASLDTLLIHLEDVTFTGILREKIGNLKIKKIPAGEDLCQHFGWPKDLPTNTKIINRWKYLSNHSFKTSSF